MLPDEVAAGEVGGDAALYELGGQLGPAIGLGAGERAALEDLMSRRALDEFLDEDLAVPAFGEKLGHGQVGLADRAQDRGFLAHARDRHGPGVEELDRVVAIQGFPDLRGPALADGLVERRLVPADAHDVSGLPRPGRGRFAEREEILDLAPQAAGRGGRLLGPRGALIEQGPARVGPDLRRRARRGGRGLESLGKRLGLDRCYGRVRQDRDDCGFRRQRLDGRRLGDRLDEDRRGGQGRCQGGRVRAGQRRHAEQDRGGSAEVRADGAALVPQLDVTTRALTWPPGGADRANAHRSSVRLRGVSQSHYNRSSKAPGGGRQGFATSSFIWAHVPDHRGQVFIWNTHALLDQPLYSASSTHSRKSMPTVSL